MKQVIALTFIALVLLSTTLTQIPGAFAITIGQTTSATKILIGIQFDQACLTYLKMNKTCNGLTYKTLQPLENVNQVFSGKWTNTPYYHKLTPKVKNSWIAYDVPFVVNVDPDPDYTTKAYMIIVKADHFVFINKDEIVTNGTRSEYHDRYVELPACDNALVYADYNLIKDTVKYLENGCTKTDYNTQHKITPKLKPFDMTSQYSSLKMQTYLKSIFHGNKQLHNEKIIIGGGLGPGECFIHKCGFTDPYKKPGW